MSESHGSAYHKWWFRNSSDLGHEDITQIAPAIHSVFKNGFGIEGWSERGIIQTIERSQGIGLLLDYEDQVHGYAIYSRPQQLLLGRALIWEEAICISRHVQGDGYSCRALDQAIQLLERDDHVAWLAGRTQNPIVMHRYEKHGFCYPFDADYASAEGIVILNFLRTHIAEVRDVPQLDMTTGICRNVYRERILGKYPWDNDSYFERKLLEMGFRRGGGDAVVVTARI